MMKILLSLMILSQTATPQSRLLDNFDSLKGWTAVTSEGAKLTLRSGEGSRRRSGEKAGAERADRGMLMEFDLSGAFGYTIARKSFSFDLPQNYQFTFDMKAEAPVNNFEFKLIDSLGNVWWIKKLNVNYPPDWTKQHVRKRHIAYAWGPSGSAENAGGSIRHVTAIEFVVSTGTGGKGKVYIDNFRLETIDDSAAANAKASYDASSIGKGYFPELDSGGTVLRNWASAARNTPEWIAIDFGFEKEIGGVVLDWKDTAYASAYEVQLSDDGKEWSTDYRVRAGNGGRDYISLPEKNAKVLRIRFERTGRGRKQFGISRLEVKGPGFSSTPNDFFFSIAKDFPRGCFPKYFLNQQCYWTIVGTSGDTREALINETGTVEVDQQAFSLEPFLFTGNKLVTWNDVALKQSLEEDYLPIPSVTWTYGGLELTTRAFSAGTAGKSMLIVTYKIENKGSAPPRGKLFVALRPYQVNPPWQFLNHAGGASRIDSISYQHGIVRVRREGALPLEKLLIPVSAPSDFGATSFDGGEIIESLVNGNLPPSRHVHDETGFASAALEYDYSVESGTSAEFHVALPFHDYDGSPTPGMHEPAYVQLALDATRQLWESKLNAVRLSLPSSAKAIVNTVRSNIAYIFINRDGPAIHPGSRSYERSWIRDGSLTSTALLQMGITREVKEYLDWYAKYQFPSGKIPCVVDQRGADPTPEHDSHGEFIYAVMQYFRFTRDSAWLRSKFEHVVKTVRYIQSLRAERKTDAYRNGTPEQQACFGLLPESISHEGYSSKPMHSYWDDFFTLRGLKDATSIAGILGEKKLEEEFAAERDDFRNDLTASIRLAMRNKQIDYVPGCVELGDFDATSTTIGVNPANEFALGPNDSGRIPEPQLHTTFDKYFDYFTKRRDSAVAWKDYTPYENRVIGTFVYLDQKERALDAMKFFMHDRRPAAWNQWAEVVYRDPSTPGFIGDMPHTWVGSDFIRSVRAMFVYEREQDDALVIGAGIPEEWLSEQGVEVKSLPTYYGPLSYTMTRTGPNIKVEISGNGPIGRILLKNPLRHAITSVLVNGKEYKRFTKDEVVLEELPADVELRY